MLLYDGQRHRDKCLVTEMGEGWGGGRVYGVKGVRHTVRKGDPVSPRRNPTVCREVIDWLEERSRAVL